MATKEVTSSLPPAAPLSAEALIAEFTWRAEKMRRSADLARECGMPGSAPTFEEEAASYESAVEHLARLAHLEAEHARLSAALPEIVRLLGCVDVKDCGAHYCRYCSAKSPDWNHESYCAYEQSQRDSSDARRLRATLLGRCHCGRPAETANGTCGQCQPPLTVYTYPAGGGDPIVTKRAMTPDTPTTPDALIARLHEPRKKRSNPILLPLLWWFYWWCFRRKKP